MKNYYSVLLFLSLVLSSCASTPTSISPFQPPSEDKPHAELQVSKTKRLFFLDEPTMSINGINGQSMDGKGEVWKLQPYSSSIIPVGDTFIEVNVLNNGDGYVYFYAKEGERYTISSQQKPHYRFSLTVTDSQQHQVDTRIFGSKYTPVSYDNKNPLFDAIAANDAKKVEYLLQTSADPNRHGSRLNSLSLAALENNLEIIQLLIAAGADANTPQGVQALRRVANNGNFEIAQVLLDNGSDLNLRGVYHKNTALMEAALNGHIKMVKLFLQHGAYIQFHNREGKTAADLAKEAGYQKIADLINHHTD